VESTGKPYNYPHKTNLNLPPRVLSGVPHGSGLPHTWLSRKVSLCSLRDCRDTVLIDSYSCKDRSKTLSLFPQHSRKTDAHIFSLPWCFSWMMCEIVMKCSSRASAQYEVFPLEQRFVECHDLLHSADLVTNFCLSVRGP
jgi:hypothetical protein